MDLDFIDIPDREGTFVTNNLGAFPVLAWLTEYIGTDKDVFIGGGCFKDILTGKKPKDIDIFFANEEAYQRKRGEFLSDSNMKYLGENTRVLKFLDKRKGLMIDVCKPTFSTPKDMLKTFDFTVSQFVLYLRPDFHATQTITDKCFNVQYHHRFFEHLAMKVLVVDRIRVLYPRATMRRIVRYVGYGYKVEKQSLETVIKEIERSALVGGNPLDDCFYEDL